MSFSPARGLPVCADPDHDTSSREEAMTSTALPPVVDADTWQRELDDLRTREKAATRELDAIAAHAGACRWCEMPDYTLEGEDGPVRLADVFDGKRAADRLQPHVVPGRGVAVPGLHRVHQRSSPGWSSWTTTTPGSSSSPRARSTRRSPTRRRVGNKMTWYSTANSPFGADMGAPPGGGFQVNVFLRDGDTVYRTYNTAGPRHRAAQPHLRPDRPAARTGARRSGRTRPRAGRSRPPTAGGPAPRTSPRSTATRDVRPACFRGW